MGLLIDQLRRQHRDLEAQVVLVDRAVASGDVKLTSLVQNLTGTVLSHIELTRWAVLPELARSDREHQQEGLAQRALSLAKDLETMGASLRKLLQPFGTAPIDAAKFRVAWPELRSIVLGMLSDEAAIADLHTPRAVSDRDRRVTPRAQCDCAAKLLGQMPVQGTVADLSLGGMLLQLPEPLPPVGTRIEVEVHLPGVEAPLRLRAEVRRRVDCGNGKAGVGTQFISLPTSAGMTIAAFLVGTAFSRSTSARHLRAR